MHVTECINTELKSYSSNNSASHTVHITEWNTGSGIQVHTNTTAAEINTECKSQGALIQSASKSHVVPIVEFELRRYRVPCVLFRECHSWSAVDDTSIVFFSFSPVISDPILALHNLTTLYQCTA